MLLVILDSDAISVLWKFDAFFMLESPTAASHIAIAPSERFQVAGWEGSPPKLFVMQFALTGTCCIWLLYLTCMLLELSECCSSQVTLDGEFHVHHRRGTRVGVTRCRQSSTHKAMDT